ncbi:MAG TPA: tetratricopeptide repeat protein [Terriglobales bacterium]
MSTSRRWGVEMFLGLAIALLSAAAQGPPDPAPDWQHTVREQAGQGKFDEALKIVETRLAAHPDDAEARAWHGRLLAWKGRWAEAESEYLQALRQAPDDVEILTALADVLFWQKKLKPALEAIDRARARAPADREILLRRARILEALGNIREARAQFRQALLLNPHDRRLKAELAALSPERKHELRLGNDVDTFNYADAAQTQTILLNSRWNRQWSTAFSSSIYQRFGQQAQKFAAASTFRISHSDWIGIAGAGANDHGIVPKREASFEYGHGFRLQNPWIRGMEVLYQQRWLWYTGAHVLTIGLSQTYYLPHDWAWTLAITGARSGFADTGVDWSPSGNTRLAFPIHRRLSGNVSFAMGSESYAQVDQIGYISARSFAGGLRLHFTARQDVAGYVARQYRSQNRSQTSYGVSYGIHF